MKKVFCGLMIFAVFVVSAADPKPTYTLGSPRPAKVNNTTNEANNVWLATNAVFVATAGFEAFDSVTTTEFVDGDVYQLIEGESGFAWERAKPEYYLADVLDVPDGVDWNATYDNWQADQEKNTNDRWSSGFLFNPHEDEPCVYVVSGGNQAFEWVMRDGTTNKVSYVVGSNFAGRPRRIYWTEAPYNGPKVSLAGKFVKFFGNDELLTLKYDTVSNLVGGTLIGTDKKVTRGLYVDPSSETLCAVGELSGQCVMVYYDTGNYENILHVQVVEVRSPEALFLNGTIGEALKPDGQGYPIEGLTAYVSTGIGNSADRRGDYLYQHSGQYSYSPKNGDVFPLRPTVGQRWLASIYWMETDAMNVQWPFEYDQYENDWPEYAQTYVRGDLTGANGQVDYGAKIYIDSSYSAKLEDYQESANSNENHAVAVDGNNAFFTKGEGYSLLRLTADDNIWFLPIHSVLRSNTNYFTLASSRVTVGRELTLRGGSRSGLAGLHMVNATADEPGYIYKPASGTQYDSNLYHEKTASSSSAEATSDGGSTTNLVSSIYAIRADEEPPIEVWWSERVELEDAPAAITIPVLPQVYKTVWPEDGEMPQIVIASQKGSANEMIFQQGGAAYFDSDAAVLTLADRTYFPSGVGTIAFWTRPAVYADDDKLKVTNAPCQLLALGQMNAGANQAAVLSIGIETNETAMLVVRHRGKKFLSAEMPKLKTCNEWTHVALAFDESGTRLVINGGVAVAVTKETLGAELEGFLDGNVLGYDDNSPNYDLYDLAVEMGGGYEKIDRVTFLREKAHYFYTEEEKTEYSLYGKERKYSAAEHMNHVEAVIDSYKAKVLEGLKKTYGEEVPCNLDAAVGRQIAEVQFRSRALSVEEIERARYEVLTGDEGGLTGYYTFQKGTDLNLDFQSSLVEVALFYERVHGDVCEAYGVVCTEPGAPARGTGVISSETAPSIYRQNDEGKGGYNPNEEHAFLSSGSGGYVTWALRTDLNETNAPPAAVFVEYGSGGKGRIQMFDVLLTNETWATLGATCEAGTVLPGPHPFDLFDNPWLGKDYFESAANGSLGVGYRDRKGQFWGRAAGELKMHMFYAMQEGFDFPQLEQQPAVGTPIPWLALLDKDSVGANRNVLTASPAAWTWNLTWPKTVAEMKIGQTLTTAANGLAEVWNAKSMAVIYPNPTEAEKTVLLTDPTVVQSVDFDYSNLAKLGLSTDKNGGLTRKKGKIYFTDLPPHLSSRLYLDSTNNKLCFMGEMQTSAAGASILYPNVLSVSEREIVKALPRSGTDSDIKTWTAAVNKLATTAVRPSVGSSLNGEIVTAYKPVDHYALAAMGATNYVTLIENDATNSAMSVSAGDPINMHIFKVAPEYYTGRIVTREDEVNLLSQQLSVIYTESFLGEADNYTFEWRKADPNPNGTVPTDYDNIEVYKAGTNGNGLVRHTVGAQGDTLANMVNTYWICRYRAKDKTTPAYAVMSTNWSAWCAPPALAEGWVQRVLNNITPFNQRMTDLYENKAETAISMIQIAGKPYTGDVALNQDNMTSVGLIELYETILNKAESLSLQLKINNEGANKQLLLAVERLQDLYTLLGDEAYTDAKNPTIGMVSTKSYKSDNTFDIDAASYSSALFCFDNQVSSLLDEELALLRGRTCESAPVRTTGPYYNRLLWNFTKGITAGEVAYAVNYNIEGTETVALSEEQAATLYPQGHGDAYGHYLSALKGWYRLIRNPNFTWPVAQGEMVVADSTVNVDYYEEAKFAEAAAKLAKTAADCVDLTARKACRDTGGSALSGYVDVNTNRAYGAGEWAVRGGYGALVNWVTANSLLPEDSATLSVEEFAEKFEDGALTRIDRGTVDELEEICESAARVQSQLDELDAGMNPLGLSDAAIPFDITPIGAADGTKTHFEQIRERAGTALSNARAVLERAQETSNRLKLLQASSSDYATAIATQEAAYNKELIGYYGTPYSDDIGPSGTYAQGYDGPDLIHYMWMDLSKFGLTEVADTRTYTNVYFSSLSAKMQDLIDKKNGFSDYFNKAKTSDVIVYEITANGLIKKPDNITGRRTTQGTIQDKYAEFLQAYVAALQAERAYNTAMERYNFALEADQGLGDRYYHLKNAQKANLGVQESVIIANKVIQVLLNTCEFAEEVYEGTREATTASIPASVIAGMAISTNPKSIVCATLAPATVTMRISSSTAKKVLEDAMIGLSAIASIAETVEKAYEIEADYYANVKSVVENLLEKANAVSEAEADLGSAIIKMNVAVEAYNAEVAKGETCLEEREAARKVQVNKLSQARYKDMFFRMQLNDDLSRYSQSFNLAQKYTFLAAQAYDYETTLLSSDSASGDAFKEKIIGARSLGAFDSDGNPMVGGSGDTGLAGVLAEMDANWLVLKPRLGINNPQPYATWFSLRRECFRILPDETGDDAWAKELSKYWVDDITSDPEFVRYCQPFQSQYGTLEKEPGLIIPFSTTIDFAKNLFGNDLAGGDSAYDSTWYSTRIAAAGLWFDGYNSKAANYKGNTQLAATPVAYLVPVGNDCMRVPGLDEGTYVQFAVQDQVVPAPYTIGSTHLNDTTWVPSMLDGDYAGADSAAKIRRHPSFRAYFDSTGAAEPDDSKLDATRLVGRSVWNTRWLLIIPAGGMNANREKALSVFINGSDENRDGVRDLNPVSDIRIGFKTYSHSGN